MADKPSFLIGIDETPEEKEITDVLRDEPLTPEEKLDDKSQDKPTAPAGDTANDSGAPADGADGKPAAGTDAGAGTDVPDDGSAGAGDVKPVAPVDGDKKPDAKAPEETPEQAAARQVNLKFGTFKSAEDAEAAFKEMQRTLTKLSQNKQPQPGQSADQKAQDNLSKFTQLAKSQPLVDVKLPKSEDYRLDNGNFDLDGYGRDLVRNVVMSIQQSLIGGQLGAMQFGLLQEAMGQDFQEARGAQEHTQKAASVEQKILTTYPIFKTNTQASDLLETTIYGEVAKRAAAAAKAGKEPEPLSEEDFLKIAETLVKNLNIPVAPQSEDAADAVHRSPTMQPTGSPRLTGVDADIDAMMQVKSKSGSIF
jgi:hypothetical protein